MLERIEKRLHRMEQELAKIKFAKQEANCTCRGSGKRIGETKFHTTAELERIIAVGCPVHGERELGLVWWTPRWMELIDEDWEFCDCPPNFNRDLRMRKIPLPEDESERRRIIEELRFQDKLRPEPSFEFKTEKGKFEQVMRDHEKRLAARGSSNGK